MDRIRPQKPSERSSERLSSRTRKLVETAAIYRLRRPWTVFIPNAKTCLCRPFMTRWTAFAPRDRINAPLSGFHPKRETCLRTTAIGCPRGVWTAPAPIMAIMSAADTSCRIRSAFFPKRKVYGQANRACITCNTYSVPYKGKDLKKRLSPKSPNTLIHSYVTFYIFLIFQYLSLWKSVFSPN